MRLEEILWLTSPTGVSYSQYLRRSDGIWCRLIKADEDEWTGRAAYLKFQYMYQYPAPSWEGGLWSHTEALTDLEVKCFLSICTPSTMTLPPEAKIPLRMPKDHFEPFTDEELKVMLPFEVAERTPVKIEQFRRGRNKGRGF